MLFSWRNGKVDHDKYKVKNTSFTSDCRKCLYIAYCFVSNAISTALNA